MFHNNLECDAGLNLLKKISISNFYVFHSALLHICLSHCIYAGALVTFVWLLSSNCFPGKRQSHIGCICLTSPLCAFKRVLKLYNHTGYICLTFLHCVFKNVSSNGLPDWIQNHTGYIFLLHCVFPNESSNGLPERMHLCIIPGRPFGCIRLTFLHCALWNISSNCTNYFVLQNIVIEYTGRVPSIHPGPISSADNS